MESCPRGAVLEEARGGVSSTLGLGHLEKGTLGDLGKGKNVFSMWERCEPLEPERELWLTAKNLEHIYCQIPAVSVHWPKKNIAKRSNVRWRTWKRSTLALHKVLSGGPQQLYAFICAGIQVVSFSWKVSSIQIESEVDIYLMPFSMVIIHLFSKNAKIILGWGERECSAIFVLFYNRTGFLATFPTSWDILT